MALSVMANRRAAFASASRARAAPRMVAVVARAQQQGKVQQVAVSSVLAPAAITAVTNLLMAMPAAAEGGKLFDFNLTLPIMAGQFLLLMVFLDKTWFTPVGKVLDERDGLIRDKLSSVKDNSSEVDKLLSEAEEILKAARAEVSALVNSQKQAKQAELDAVYATAKAKINKEVTEAIAGLEKESGNMLKSLDSQVDKIANEVLRRVLPEGVKV